MTAIRPLSDPRLRQRLVNAGLFLVIGQYAVREAHSLGVFSRPALVDAAFFAHNAVFLALILVRRDHVAVDRHPGHWLVAVLSFFSNFFFGKEGTAPLVPERGTSLLTLAAIAVGILALLSLGRSFGIVPAIRKVRTGGLYRFVRHPVYLSDILFKVPIVLKYFSAWNALVFLLAAVLYVLRIRFEEALLTGDPSYRAYAEKVRYRLVPLLY